MSVLYTEHDSARIEKEIYDSDGEWRSPWRRDYARVIHSPAFRRLQGKTQLFPGVESDFFRNRLTHSLEVAQIAKSIALKLNAEVPYLQNNNINVDIVEIAGLCHDIGHPPFGHNGERALDERMRQHGGFEGNAQTLRILTRLEKRCKLTSESEVTGITDDHRDRRRGLNLCFRTIASVLKYDNAIPKSRIDEKVTKGFYLEEKMFVDAAKRAVAANDVSDRQFRTIECQIMDVADDIAYSTYDFEDALKADFLDPLDLLAPNYFVVEAVVEEVKKSIVKDGGHSGTVNRQVVLEKLAQVFKNYVYNATQPIQIDFADAAAGMRPLRRFAEQMRRYSSCGYHRAELTSKLVTNFVAGVRCTINDSMPALSRVYLEEETYLQVEILKNFVYQSLVLSSRVKVAEYRGFEIVGAIFEALCETRRGGQHLLPDDAGKIYKRLPEAERMRVICDFIAGMTDRYALEFYGRLRSENPQTIFKPL